MNPVQIPFLVEACIMGACLGVGVWLRRGGRPFAKLKLVAHILLFLWLATGYYFILSGFLAMPQMAPAMVPVLLMGALLGFQIVSGVKLLLAPQALPRLARWHYRAAVALIVTSLIGLLLS